MYNDCMKLFFNLLVSTLAILVTAYVVPGIVIDSYITAVVLAVILGALNTIVRPILLVLTLPINLVTLGAFTLIINGLMVYLAAMIVPGFGVGGYLNALIFGLVLSVVNIFFNIIKK